MKEQDITTGDLIYKLIEDLFPITRSLTGDGVRKTLETINGLLPSMEVVEVPTGTPVYDWEIPNEWNIRNAYIKDPKGETVVSMENNNLHVVGYSQPIHEKMSLTELKENIHTLPEHPDWIPYVTSYYKPAWGFCMTHNNLKKLKGGTYEVCIESTHKEGNLVYGEYFKKGKSKQEFLLSCYICHPSMASDSLSGVGLLAYLAKELENRETHYSYRFIFIPETIGAITWLAQNEATVDNIRFGLVSTCIGDSGPFTYKKSRRDNAEIDAIVEYVLNEYATGYEVEDFFPFGSDERQFCSPGFNLPVGSLMRSRYSNYDEYHTSADDMDFIDPVSLDESFYLYKKAIEIAEVNHTYINTNPKGEPNLGKRGLFESAKTYYNYSDIQSAYLWLLNYSDGKHSVLDIAGKSGLEPESLDIAAQNLRDTGLLEIK